MAWLAALISRTAAAGGPGHEVMENIQAYLFKTSVHLNATWGLCDFTSFFNRATPPGGSAAGITHISPLLPHVNPKQIRVMKCASSSFVLTIWAHQMGGVYSTGTVRQHHRVFYSQFFPVIVKAIWYYIVNVSFLASSGLNTMQMAS